MQVLPKGVHALVIAQLGLLVIRYKSARHTVKEHTLKNYTSPVPFSYSAAVIKKMVYWNFVTDI